VSRRGFTLIELMVALVVAGAVVLVAERTFAGTVDTGRAVADSRHALDREMNARRLLAAAFASIEVGQHGAEFDGRPGTVRFVSWLQGADGWFERGTVTLGLDRGRFVLRAQGARPIPLAEGVATLEFDYLIEPGADSRWVREWVSPVSAPLAMRVRLVGAPGSPLVADTAIYLVKARG
jgi:prepilin-type N-terminal cleavage/methylation domain-containing protein